MKKHIFIALLLSVSLWAGAWTSPVEIPSVGQARLRIVGQNVQNYLLDFTASNASCKDQESFETKTNKIANAFLAMEADIIAICEVERNPAVLGYICDEMNRLYGSNVYTYVSDELSAEQSSDGYMALKSGFIYRSDKVAPEGSTTSPYYSSSQEYHARMRIQAFKEISTGELFVLSVNHFKAKGGVGGGESTRINNAKNLINTLKYISTDPDILVMGDLNAYMGEQPIHMLDSAGYAEQLTRFDENAYTYIYMGERGILDHAMANSTMADQVTGASVYHINTAGGYDYRYSDHDAVLVGLDLGKKNQKPEDPPVEEDSTACVAYKFDFTQGFEGFTQYNYSGGQEWKTNSTYGLQINLYYSEFDDQTHWLVSPQLDLSQANEATLTLNHQIYYDNGTTGDYEQDQTMWISTDYMDGELPTNYTWTQLPLSNYGLKKYTDATAAIPAAMLTDKVHIAFKYDCNLHWDANYWEIKRMTIGTDCPDAPSAIDNTKVSTSARKIMWEGRLYIVVDDRVFDVTGREISK